MSVYVCVWDPFRKKSGLLALLFERRRKTGLLMYNTYVAIIAILESKEREGKELRKLIICTYLGIVS